MKHSKTPQQLLIIELLDKNTVFLLNRLKEIFNGRPSKSLPHITIRGPYSSNPSSNIVNDLKKTIEKKKSIMISGPGIFSHNGKYVVYLKINGDDLRKVSWKLNYPKKKFGFNPHVTLYEGIEKEKAERIYNFLRMENIKLSCSNFDLARCYLNQYDLFTYHNYQNFRKLSVPKRQKKALLKRAKDLVEDYSNNQH